MKKILLLLLALILAFVAGNYVAYTFFNKKEPETQNSSAILLERVRKVLKLVTIEAQFQERYTEKNIRPITLYIPFPTTWNFPKEASILITGTVMVGYDMENIEISMDGENRIVHLRNLPEPEIIAIDHEIEYENLSESYFNAFTKEDYTQLAKNAKDELRNKAVEQRLLNKAREEGNEMVSIIETIVTAAGWTLQVENKPAIKEVLE